MTTQRFFKNPYRDYEGGEVGIDNDRIVGMIRSYVGTILEQSSPGGKRGDLYVGDAGIAYMFWKLHTSSLRDQFPALESAVKYIEGAKRTVSSRFEDQCSFLCGNAGIYAVSTVIAAACGKDIQEDLQKFKSGYNVCSQPNFAPRGGDEFLVGRCGYLAGIYFLNHTLNRPVIQPELVSNICTRILESGHNYSQRHRSGIPLMYQYHESEYLGAAHGLSAILWALLEAPQTDADMASIRSSLDAFLTMQENGDFPTRWKSRDKFLVHWCHGAPGAIYLLAKAYQVFGDEKYKASCQRCCDSIWERGLLLKGPGICHGVAGNGYAFLLMYRLTHEKKYLHRAYKFAEFLTTEQFNHYSRQPDRPYSLYEGLAGTICFLLDLIEPSNASFPFMDIFANKHV